MYFPRHSSPGGRLGGTWVAVVLWILAATAVRGHTSEPLAAEAHKLRAEGKTEEVNELLKQARILTARANSSAESPESQASLAAARRFLKQAGEQLDDLDALYTKQLETFPKLLDPKKEASRIEERDRLRGELLSHRLLAAQTYFDLALTYAGDAPPRSELLGEALARYKQLHEKYRRLLAGNFARLGEGRCLEELGKTDEAIGCYRELYRELATQTADDPAFHNLAIKAAARETACLVRQEKFAESTERGKELLETSRAAAQESDDWLSLKYQLAVAHRGMAESLEEGSSDRRRHWKQAHELARDVANGSGVYRREASLLLASLSPAGEAREPASFAEAFEAAEQQLERLKTARMGLDLARRNNQQSAVEFEKQLAESRNAAMALLERAVELADDQTPEPERHRARYYLCFTLWEAGNYEAAADAARSLAAEATDPTVAQQTARIGLASLQKLSAGGEADDRQATLKRLRDLAEWAADRWPETVVADEARSILAGAAAQSDDWQDAVAHVTAMAADRRAIPQLKLGLSLWSRYLQQSQRADRKESSDPELVPIKDAAQKALEAGLAAAARIEDDPSAALKDAARLSLAQMAIESRRYQEAVAILEDEPDGPLARARSLPETSDREKFVEQTYQAAIQAYVALGPAESDKAVALVESLEQLIRHGDPDGAEKRLAGIYTRLGRQLEMQWDALQVPGDDRQRRELAAALSLVLDRAAAGAPTGDWAVWNWIAQAYAKIGRSAAVGNADGQPSSRYLSKALEAYDAMLEGARKQPESAPSADAVLALMLRRAACLREMERYGEALEQLVELLLKRPNMLEAQIAAATTYQQRADAEDAKWYPRAWNGGRLNTATGQKLIWGWAKLANVAAAHAEHRETFYESRYHLALCRYRFALKQQDTEKQKYLGLAENDIRLTAELYPDLGGPLWKPRFEALLRSIRQASGKPGSGKTVSLPKSKS